MKYENFYRLEYTWRKSGDSKVCYTEVKDFDTKLERNRYALNLFSNQKEGKIELDFVQKSDIQTWRK